MRRFGDPSRCAYGMGSFTNTAANNAFVSLFNDSNQYHLGIFAAGLDISSIQTIDGFVVAQGIQGAAAEQGQPVVTGRGPVAGVITTGEVVTKPSNNFPTLQAASSQLWQHDFPFLVLYPGWSLSVYASLANNTPLVFGFWWEVLLPDELLNPKIGNPDIDP